MPLYLYAVLRESPAARLSITGVEGEPLRVVEVAGFSIVVGSTAGVPAATLTALRLHDAAIRAVAAAAPGLVPMQFGQLATEGELEELLTRASRHLRDSLERIQGAVQMTLRVECPALEIGEREPDPEESGPRPAGAGTRYLRARLQQHVLEHSPPKSVRGLLAQLAPFVKEQRIERGLNPRPHARIYHLVGTHDVKPYRERLDHALSGRSGPVVSASGPWPPYAFVSADPFAARPSERNEAKPHADDPRESH